MPFLYNITLIIYFQWFSLNICHIMIVVLHSYLAYIATKSGEIRQYPILLVMV